MGVAKLTEDDGEVLVRVTVHDLPAGFHGFHVHETGTCTPAGFTSAGFHLDLAGTGSGGTPHPSEAGDLPVLLVNADGSGEARFKTDRFDVADLLAGDGTAFIIHLNPDNYANIPARYLAPPATITAVDQATKDTGDAGGRIACGVVQASD
ncbi:MAG: superoxide dismutase family protein [Dehalococcoidia bacterium]|nr:superoxide dismutase family protein [Dehalococcoidia bacterium]